MAHQKKGLPLPLSFNVSFGDSSSDEENKQHPKKIALQNLQNVPKSRYQPPQLLFANQPHGKNYVRKSIISKLTFKSKLVPYSSTPKLLTVNNNNRSEIDFSPINKTKHKGDDIHTSYDDLPPSKRSKITKSASKDDIKPAGNESKQKKATKNNITEENNYQSHVYERKTSSIPESDDFVFQKPAEKGKIISSNKTLQNKIQNITVRKTLSKQQNISHADQNHLDILAQCHEIANSGNLIFEKDIPRSDSNSRKVSLNTSCNLPCHSKEKKIQEAMAEFDHTVGLTASVISISSDCITELDPSYQAEISIPKEVSRKMAIADKKNITDPNPYIKVYKTASTSYDVYPLLLTSQGKTKEGANTANSKSPPKTFKSSSTSYDDYENLVQKQVVKDKQNSSKTSNSVKRSRGRPPKKNTVGTQKNAIRDISTNTTPYRDDSDDDVQSKESIVEKERSKKSIGLNTTKRDEQPKVKKRIYSKKCERSVILNNESSNTDRHNPNNSVTISGENMSSLVSARQSLRPRTKVIDYSYSTSFSSTNNKQTSDDTSVQVRNNRTTKQTKKRRKTTLIPSKLKTTKPKSKKDNDQRLSGFYEMAIQKPDHNRENESGNRRSRRPPSLFIQSHVVGSSSLKNVLLKRVTSHKIQETSEKKTRGSSVARESTRTKNKKQNEISNNDDTTFKKPLPVTKSRSRTSASTTNSSVSTIGYDKEHLICSPPFEAIDEIPYEDSEMNSNTSVKESRSSQEVSRTNRKHSPVKSTTKSVSPTKKQYDNYSLNTSTRSHSSTKPVETDKSPLKDSGLATGTRSSSNSNSITVNVSPRLKQTRQSDIVHNEFNKQDTDASSISPLNNAVYEVEDSLNTSNSLRKETSHTKTTNLNCTETVRKNSTPDKNLEKNNSLPGSSRENTKESSVIKARKSVTFLEPVAERVKLARDNQSLSRTRKDHADESNENVCAANTALVVSDRKNSIQPTDFNDDFGDTTADSSKGALCTVVNNKPVLLRNWNAEMPDVSSMIDSSVRYTLKNIPFGGSAVTSGYFVLGPRQKKSKHATMKQALFFHVLNGEARIYVQGEKIIVKPGSHFVIPLGCIYSISNTSSEKNLVLFFVKLAPEFH